jgi:site-specific recombinase XerC
MALAMKISNALESFLLHLDANGRSPHTRSQYARHVRMLIDAVGDVEIDAVDHVAIARFLTSPAVREKRGGGPRKATSANGLRSSLRTFFAWVHAAGYAKRNAAALVQRARCGPPPPRTISDDDQARLLAALGKATDPEGRRDHALFTTMLRTGIRVGSAVALDAGDLDLGRGELRLGTTKGNRPARVLVPREVVELLRGYLAGRTSGPLFPGRRGERITTRHVARRLKAWLQRAGIEGAASPHSLRHSFARRVYEKTGDLLVTQAALGHASIASTTVYARVAPERLRAALGA